MQYNDVSGKQGLVQDTLFLLGNSVDFNNYTIEDMTRNINQRFHMVWDMIFEAYGGWQFVDNNQTAYPFIDINFEQGEDDVDIPIDVLTIRGAEILDPDTNVWVTLTPLTREEYLQMGGQSYFTSSGSPVYYLPQGGGAIAKGGNVAVLPEPNYTQDATLRLYVDRTISEFGINDTTAIPGFASPFHRALSVGAALDYAMTHTMTDKVSYLTNLWNDYERRIQNFYSKRFLELSPKKIPPAQDLVEEFM